MAPARRRKPWLLLVGGATLLCLFLAGGLYVLWNLIDGEPTPTAVSQVQPTPTTVSQVQATPTVESQAAAVPTPAVPEQVQYPPGWTNYGNANFVSALARQDDYLWAGGESGLVRWDLIDGSYAKFGREDGLASGRINDLLVDEEGVFWIATDAGISRYDGDTWITYDEADGLDANWIQALFQDEFGDLWAGSRGGERGLNHFEGARWGAPSPNFLPPLPVEYPSVTVMGGNEDVGYFVGLEDEGLLLFEGESWLLLTEVDGLPAGGVLDALLTEDALWVSYEPAMVRFDLETADMETIPQGNIFAMHQAADGELWFAGAGRALRFDPDTGDWQEFETAPGPIPAWLVTDIAEDEYGLWFSTYGGGVALYDGSGWETWATDEELGGNWIDAIRQDKDGALWFTHPGSGLSRYQPEADVWQVFGQAEGALDWPSVPGVDSDGNLWIGDDELVYFDGQGWQRFAAPELTDVTIYAIEFGPGDVQWLATDSGLMRYDPSADEWATFTGADHPILEDMWSFLAASDGTLWVGGEEGLVQYDGNTWSAPVALGTAPHSIDDLVEAPDGSLWIAAYGELVHLADGRWSYFGWPTDGGWMETVAIGPDGSVWAGYEGLGHFDPSSGDWQIFTPADGLVHWIVHAIHVTPEGVVWVGTPGGVSRFVPSG